jgi:hypothetical protein
MPLTAGYAFKSSTQHRASHAHLAYGPAHGQTGPGPPAPAKVLGRERLFAGLTRTKPG